MALLSARGNWPLLAVASDDLPALTAQLRDAVLLDGMPVLPMPRERVPDDPIVYLEPEGIALVVETSGSTASPKRVALSSEALRRSARSVMRELGGHGQWLLALPTHYIAGAQVLIRSIIAGTTPVVLEGEGFDPAAFAAASARLDPAGLRFTSLVPVQLARLVDAAETDPAVAEAMRSYDRILVGGQSTPAVLVERACALGALVTRTYGSSETAGGCVYDGRPLENVGVRIVDGVVELSGPMLAEGYLGDAELTEAAFTTDAAGNRWYRTRDLGSIDDDDGRLLITGRADDVIISGGVKVVLGEVERAVRAVPGFEQAVVLRVDDLEWGERAAVVVPGTDAAAASDALGALAAATDAAGLTPAARPARLLVVDELPSLDSGKPDRQALAVLLESED